MKLVGKVKADINMKQLESDNYGIFSLAPIPFPDSDVLEKWALWEKLQANGLTAYQLAPSASCAVAGRADVEAWKEFLELKIETCVLDIGCGPLDIPEYLKGWSGVEVIGIDPLQSVTPPTGMLFVKGIGEYLPFKSSIFDSIIMATSLDHVLLQQRVLSEVKRCLKHSGRILIWLGIIPKVDESLSLTQRVRRFVSKCSKPVLHFLGLVPPLPSQPFWYQLNERLEVPPGAIDPYHFQHFDETNLQRWCLRLGFMVSRRRLYGNSVFLELQEEGV